MPSTPLKMLPGIDVEKSELLNESGFSASQLIRFFQKKAQKLGGFARITSTMLIGTCRGLFAWADLTGVGYIAAGTEQRLEVWNAGIIYDITPVYATDNLSGPFSTYSGQATIIVHDATTTPNVGDWINILTPTAIGGLILQGFYQVQTQIDSSHYTITAASAATSHAVASGTTALFHTYSGQTTVIVTLANHGLAMGGTYTVYVSTTVGGVVLFGAYIVNTVLDVNNFTITGAPAASSTTTGSENGGNVRIQYLLQTGLVSAAPAIGYGEGGYGLGPYGQGAMSGAQTPLRQWSFGNFGRILVACPIGGSIYDWDPAIGFFENPAAIVSNSPAVATGIFVAMQQQQVIAYGITDPNTMLPDPMLIGWCDVANLTVWTASATNQAGTFRLSRGSRIVGGLQGPQYGMHFTDVGVWLQQYIGFPLVYGFNEIGQGCGLISMRSVGVLGGIVYWCSYNGFYAFNGAAVVPLPCTVWDRLFGVNASGSQNANFSQQDKFLLAPDSHFNEFFYFYASITGTGEIDSYLKYQQVDNVWDYGTLTRTAWFDQNDVLVNNPLGVDGNGLIQQHETGTDADGQPMVSSITTGYFKLSEGLAVIFLERMIPDFVAVDGTTIQITVNMVNYPDDTPLFSETFTWVAGAVGSEYIIVRGRGRFAQITITSNGLGSFWRLGEFLWIGTGSGRVSGG
jgi:hypothetical protein